MEALRRKLHKHTQTPTDRQADRQTENKTGRARETERDRESERDTTYTHKHARAHTHTFLRTFNVERNCRLGFRFCNRIPDSQPVAKVFDALQASRELDHYLNQFHYGNKARVTWFQELHCRRGFLSLVLCLVQ